jgi:hypothetical protein
MSDQPTPVTRQSYDDGWKAHALGQPLPVDAKPDFADGWLHRKIHFRTTLIYAVEGAEMDEIARLADRVDL